MKTIITILLFAFLTLSAHAQIITTIAGNGIQGYTGNGGQATDAEINPYGMAADAIGNFYFADYTGNVIRKINTTGIISVVAGNGTAGYSGDGGPATTASLNGPGGIVFDRIGNLYFNDGHRIRKINTVGIICTIAGNGDTTYGGDGGPATAASFKNPGMAAIDDRGNLYVVDCTNTRIRKINTSGIINTIAGTGIAGYSGDGGPATDAKIEYITGMCVDIAENIYITDWGFNTIRKINTFGIITGFAGNPNCSAFSGDGGPATDACFQYLGGMCCDWIGNLYISDIWNQRIRAINTDGIINTIVGNPVWDSMDDVFDGDFSGDGGPASLAKLYYPNNVVLDNLGNIYINDHGNNRIRKVWGAAANVASVNVGQVSIQINPNPNNGLFTIKLPSGITNASISVTDIIGKVIEIKTTQANGKVNVDMGNAAPGTYLVMVKTGEGVYREKVTIKK